jgi:hypothetical protein
VLSSVSASLVILSSCFNASDGTATQRTTPISTRSSKASVRQAAGCCVDPRVIKIQAHDERIRASPTRAQQKIANQFMMSFLK